MKRILTLGTSVLLLAGCQTPLASVVYCQVTTPITYSRNDTLETRAQILEHNAVYEELCP